MTAGKTPGKPLDPSNLSPISQDSAEIDIRGRLCIPRRIGEKINWIKSNNTIPDALIILTEPGILTICDWNIYNQQIIDKRLELIKTANDDPDAAEALRLIEDKYRRITIPKDLRPTLGTTIIMHLGLSQGKSNMVYIASMPNEKLIVMSGEFRNKKLSNISDLLFDLP